MPVPPSITSRAWVHAHATPHARQLQSQRRACSVTAAAALQACSCVVYRTCGAERFSHFMPTLLLDAPYWLVGLLMLVGIVLIFTGLRRQQVNLRTAGIALAALAALLLVLRFTVQT